MKTTTLIGMTMALAACGKDEVAPSQTNIAIEVAPLSLTGVADVSYTVRVRRADTTLVWEKTGLRSTQFGDGSGALAYVGPCDGDAVANPHAVELVIEGITGTGGGPIAFTNPTPLARPATCVPNTNVQVDFNVTVMRDASQGFFDVAVQFDDIFCSAKLDCVDDEGGPIELLFKGEERARTVVMGFACTSGAGETTWLHLTDMSLECGSGESYRHYLIDPSSGEGNLGPVPPVLFEVGAYRDEEELAPYDKCFWNMAFGVNEGVPEARGCVLSGQGTASSASWTTSGGMSPADTVYPYIDWRVNLTNAAGNVACGQHPMNADTVVTTKYTDFGGAKFTHEWECGSDVITTETVSCSATVTNVGDSSATFTQTPEGVAVAFGAEPPSALYKLPAEYGEVADCCFNPCCTEAGNR